MATNTADRGDFERFDELAALAADLTPPGEQPIPLAVIEGMRLVFNGEPAAAVDVMLNAAPGPVPHLDESRRAVALCQYQKYTDPDAAAENAAHALQSSSAPSRRAMLHGLRAISLALAGRAEEGRTDAAAAVQLLELVPGNFGRNYPALGEAAVYGTLNTAPPEVLQRAHAALLRWRDTGNRGQVWEHLHWLPLLLNAARATEHAAALAHINIKANRPILTTAPSYAPLREQLTALARLDLNQRTGEEITALGATNYAITAFSGLP
jgi:hypothetical protein